MIFFSERKELADQYEQWLKENPQIKDCPFNVISFLAGIGRLKSKKEDWIPCEVDMPKEKGYYQVTVYRYEGDEDNVFDLWFEDGEWYVDEIGDNEEDIAEKYFIHEVIAWQPLPQPYKKEGAE